jgi:thymidylate synthase (FAD)
MARITTPEAEALVDVELPIYGGQGFVKLIDYMGGDARIVQACRVSYGAGTKSIREDKGLINHIVRHQHTSPLEKPRFEIMMSGIPLPMATQWLRHRMGSFNFKSYRYSEVEADDQFTLEAGDVRAQSVTNKQMSDGQAEAEAALAFVAGLGKVQVLAQEVYDQAIEGGVAREQARLVMPQTTTTAFYWTVDLWNALRFLVLRLAPDAQSEIQEPARRVAECVQAVCPLAYEAFEEHMLYAERFSRSELEVLRETLRSQVLPETLVARVGKALPERAANEFMKKLGV